MWAILLITVPSYLLMGAGFFAVYFKRVNRSEIQFIGRLLVTMIVPVVVFQAISQYQIDDIWRVDYLLIYALGSILLWGLSFLWNRSRGNSMPLAAFSGLGMSMSNSFFVGYPIISLWAGGNSQVEAALALCLIVENLLIFPVTFIASEMQAQLPWRQALRLVMLRVIRNPILVAIVLALLCSLLQWRLPVVLQRTAQLIGYAAAPLSLFMIGGVLVGQRVVGIRLDIAAITFGKLVLHPLMMLGLAFFIPSPLAIFAVAFAAMPLPSTYPALALKYGLDGLCASALVVVTVTSFVTINLWLWVLPQLFP